MTSILAIEGALPDGVVTNTDLEREHPSWEMDLVAELAGVDSRRICAEDETAFDLSLRACQALLERPDVDVGDIEAILYCTPSPDHPIPGNAHLLHRQIGFEDDVFAFDFTLACSGYVYGLAFADAVARGGMGSKILLITADTPSKWMNPGDRSVRALFGDGAAATYLGIDDARGGRIVATELCTRGRGFEDVYIPAGGARNPRTEATRQATTDDSGNVRTAEDIYMNGTAVWSFATSVLPGHIEAFLTKHALNLDEIDLFVFHQGSKLILSSLARALSIPPEKNFIHMKDFGNLSSSSIPFALRAALDQGAIQPGDRVLLSAFGGGVSYGSAIVEF